MKPYFDKETTNIIKGIALIMMSIHHFFTFPSWWLDGIRYPLLERLAPYFCAPSKICVPVFCFLTGYTYFYNDRKNLRYSIKKITDLFIPYWGVFLVFAAIAAINGYHYSATGIVLELFALKRPTMIFCWYVYFYYSFMLMLPFLVRILSKDIHIDIILSAVIIPCVLKISNKYLFADFGATLSRIISDLAFWLPTVLAGFIFAKYSLFEKIDALISKVFPRKGLQIILWCFLFLFIPMGRYYPADFSITFAPIPFLHKKPVFSVCLDVIYAPVYIYAITNLCKVIKGNFSKKIIIQIGKHSLIMWFVSCAFYNNSKSVFQPILYYPHNPALVLIWGLIMCFGVSVLLDYGFTIVIRWKNNLLFSSESS